jgi:plasmid stabilization system protein ParE
MRVVWSDRALERVEEIALYIARDSVETAARWTAHLFGEVERLGAFPQSGKVGRDVEKPGIREMVWGAYRVFYEVGTDVQILTVRRCSQRLDEDEFRGD